VLLPLPLPPMLAEALDAREGARYVACWWGGGSDGAWTHAGYWPAFLALTRRHTLGRVVFDPYAQGLGLLDDEPTRFERPDLCLLLDRWEHTMAIVQAHDARTLLATQPSELAAAAAHVGPERVAGIVSDAFHAAQPPAPSEVMASLQRKNELLAELHAWLDAAQTTLGYPAR
jgi:hypothetical protein